jgi:hypothetical protein
MSKKHHVGVLVEKNAFLDEGDGVVSFPKGLVITDNTEQRNGTKYDIKSMDIEEYGGQVTADHFDMLDRIIGGVEGVAKVGNKVVVSKINYLVKENPLARLAYNLLLNSKVPTNYSIETYGPMPDDDGIYHDAKLIGLSQVVVGNNRSATVNQIVLNSIEQSKEDGLDTSLLENELLKEIKVDQNHEDAPTKGKNPKDNNNSNNKETTDMTFVTIKNSRKFAVKVSYKNAAGDDVEQEVAANATLDVSDDQQEAVEKQFNDAPEPKTEPVAPPVPPVVPPADPTPPANPDGNGDAVGNALAEAIKAALAPHIERMEKAEQALFDKGGKEPEFKKNNEAKNNNPKNEYAAMDWRDRHAKQINAAWDLLKRKDQSGATILNDINEVNLEHLKKDGVVRNSMTISDFGNFVISRELLAEIEGCRNDYTPLVNATTWKETLATQFAWLSRSGDISMSEVEFCDDGDDGNLKPISEYGATINTSDLKELAAVTPVCNAATRFLAADLLGDVAAGYRNDYDRKRAQLVIARLEQAVEHNGNSVVFDTNPNVEALVALLNAWKEIANCTPNGTFVMNTSSYATILAYALKAGISGPLSQIFTTGEVPMMFGRPYLLVSDDLMPSLDSASTVSITVEGAAVTVNHAVYYGNLSNFTGRTSGGLMYDLSTEAAYEDGDTVKSAYQRNELVLRGSFFRGGAIKDVTQVAGILAPGVS